VPLDCDGWLLTLAVTAQTQAAMLDRQTDPNPQRLPTRGVRPAAVTLEAPMTGSTLWPRVVLIVGTLCR
jgi:hypothetical protein